MLCHFRSRKPLKSHYQATNARDVLFENWPNQHHAFKTDLNEGGKVNLLDLIIFAAAFGSEPGEPGWNAMADVDHNGKVNILDLILVANDFGKVAW
jgi:hypothetical protein